MRIEANGLSNSRLSGIESGYDGRAAERAEADRSATKSADEVRFSSTANDFRVASRAIGELPDVREDRVAELKARIQAGQYNPSAEEIATKMIGG